MNGIVFYFPLGYYIKTRLNTRAALLFHGYAEYLLGVLLLLYAGNPVLQSITNFVLAYIAFISIYEIGYIINDFISIKFEKNPRKRLGKWNPSEKIIYIWIGIRVAVFLLLTYLLDVFTLFDWWLFYFILVITFFLHNILKIKESKIFTFISLAFLRFYAPIYLFLDHSFLVSTFSGIILFYVFFRTITYIDSKGLLIIPSRASFSFKVNYYIFLLPLSLAITLLAEENLCLFLNFYFLFFLGVILFS